MIKGFDISHWNGKDGVSVGIKAQPDARFVFIKATEGRTYKDPQMYSNFCSAETAGLMVGFYHYSRPENGNSPQQEAENFVNAIKPYIGSCVMALDWEGKALQYGQAWALAWLNAVYVLTGVKPLIYIQGSAVGDYIKVAEADYGLWIACWSGETKMKQYIGKFWDTWAVWQYTDSPLDLDRFNGSEEQFRKYMDARRQEGVLGTGHCGCCCKCGKEED